MQKKRNKLNPRTVELRKLMREHSLTTRKVGELVGRSRQAAKRWTAEFTVISQPMLDLLKYRIREL